MGDGNHHHPASTAWASADPDGDDPLDGHDTVATYGLDSDRDLVLLPVRLVGVGNAQQVSGGLRGVADGHADRDPALVLGTGRLGEEPHRRLEPVHRGDRVEGADVVLYS